VFSVTGDTTQAVDWLKVAKNNGARTLAITNHSHSKITKTADLSIYTAGKEVAQEGSTLITEMSQLYVIEQICHYLYQFDSKRIRILHSNNNRINKVQNIKEKSPSKIESDDALLINDALGIYGVMDGATPIDSFKDENGHNSAYLAANLIKGYLESLEEISYLPDEVLKVNSLLKHEMNANGINLTDKSQLWSSC